MSLGETAQELLVEAQRLPKEERLSFLKRESRRFSDEEEGMAVETLLLSGIELAEAEAESAGLAPWEKFLLVGAVLLVFAVLGLSFLRPEVAASQRFVIRTTLALACAMAVVAIPGFFELELEGAKGWAIRAGGGVGVFVLVYLAEPGSLVLTLG